ncbi:MAG: hypothetical protein IKH13_05305, partial [Clostridia bacterium]|nr:hypothetical protein [Clostridia bacterium]
NGNKPEQDSDFQVGSAGSARLNIDGESATVELGNDQYLRYTVENGGEYEVRVTSEDSGTVTAEAVSEDDGDWVHLECYGRTGKAKISVQLVNPATGEALDTKTVTVTVVRPDALEPYDGDLVYSGETYRVTIRNKTSKINYRKAPVITEKDNIAGKLDNGEEIQVDYIYDGTWAVFWMDGELVFASIYNNNDPSDYEILTPVG